MNNEKPKYIRAVIFDLDGVITNTAEFHYLAWKKLADEEGIDFARADNEALRGVSRRESLNLLLKGRKVDGNQATEMMARKNRYYREMLARITPADLLPGVEQLLQEIRAQGIKTSIASASRNAPDVVDKLGISELFDALAHGGSVERQKPAPDLFLYAAHQMGIPPGECLVVEDAQAGIEAAHAAGMVVVGLGPRDRVGGAEVVLPSLDGVIFPNLSKAASWRVVEPSFSAVRQNHRETIFTLGNGYLSTRGSFEERFPGDRQATLVHGIWDDVPISFSELANAPDWTALEIFVNGRRFDMGNATIQDYVRYLDLRTGILHRRLIWSPQPNNRIELRFERFASLADEHILALKVRVTPLDDQAEIQIRAMLDSHVENEGLLHWENIHQYSGSSSAEMVVRTRHSGKILGLSMQLTESTKRAHRSDLDCPGCPGTVLDVRVEQGETVSFEKIASVYSSRDTDQPLDAARTKSVEGARRGYAALDADQESAWADFWSASDVDIEGDDEAQLAIRHALFQLRIAAPTHDERVSIGAKTLSGFGYRGHVFWDNEIFVLPFFIYTQPGIARNLLKYRYHTLPGARRKAISNGYSGAQYPWESAESGDEVTPTWVPHFNDPTRLVRIWTGDIQIHISADIAYAMHQYWCATGDDDFWIETGIPVLLETAVFWGERAEQEGNGFAIRDVIGPDENHDHVDNNQYTNYMVRWHLHKALEALDWLEDRTPDRYYELISELELDRDVLARWRRVIEGIILLHDPETGLIEQFEGFYKLKEVDWSALEGRTQSIQEILGIEACAEHKALKQADVIALLCLLGDQFEDKTRRANWDYYVPITDHEYGSSLGPSMHAWAACRLRMPQIAYEHFMRAARADLLDVRGNAGDGMHAASAGGLWEAVVFGFAGMSITEDGPKFDPCLPPHWKRLSFNIKYHGNTHRVEINAEEERTSISIEINPGNQDDNRLHSYKEHS